MTKAMSLSDFRAIRTLLEPHEWALPAEEIPPTDLVKPEVWHGIMDLPHDVAILTSDHNGIRLELLYSLWGDWIEAIGEPGDEDELYGSMSNATDCFQACTFDLLHGYYRSALANLRSAVELAMIGVYGNCSPDDTDFQQWKVGNAEFGFTQARKRLLRLTSSNPTSWILAADAFPAQIFSQLCRYTHSRPGSGDGDLWRSNGPVFNHDAIFFTFQMALRVYAICYLLVRIARPQSPVPNDSHILFELDWLPDASAIRNAFLGQSRGHQ